MVHQNQTLGLQPTFGFGDRLGMATPGHLDALIAEGGPIKGIFAQQSIREMNRTNRSPDQVMSAAADALKREQYVGPWGSDADHLKSEQDVDDTADAGFMFYTIDPSDHVDQQADNYDGPTLEKKFQAVRSQLDWIDQYQAQKIQITDGPILRFDEATVKRAAVKYGSAINHARTLAAHIRHAAAKRQRDHEIELSVDETEQPTTLAEHYIIADQCLKAQMNLVSLAPRYLGDFEKAVDYKGDLDKLGRSLNDHAAIARHLGPYKLSLHSGSDKLSMYRLFAHTTRGLCHVKTAGTSYLEALRVVARHDTSLFRRIIDFARQRYDRDKATYHVSAVVDRLAPPFEIEDTRELERLYLDSWSDVPEGQGFRKPGRQILHCTFGSVLTDQVLYGALSSVLEAEPETYRQVLAEHFVKHLAGLRSGM